MKISDKKKKKQKTTTTDIKSTPTGVLKWIQEYRDRFSVDLDELEQNALAVLDGKQHSQTDDLTKKSAGDNNTDDDEDDGGNWTVVSHSLKKTRQRMVPSTDKTLNRLRAKHKRASEAKELTNFYKFQMTDKKIDQLEQLKLKFELDKQRIAQMRQQRKFKPF